MNNEDLFARMQKKLNEFKKEFSTSSEENECEHDTIIDNGVYVCRKCGEQLDTVYDNDFAERKNLNYRPYERTKQIRDTLKRLSGNSFGKEKDIDLDILPKDIRGIRKKLKQNKINVKNDFYYWRLKNDVSICIPFIDILNYETEYKRTQGITQKDFLYSKFKEHSKYGVFSELFKKKNVA